MPYGKQGSAEATWHENCAFVLYTHLVAIWTLFSWKPHTATVIMTVVTWFLAGIGITMGYHRLWSHKSYNAIWPLRLFLALMGTLSFQGSIRWWVQRHRLHHRFTDTANDPYNAKRGFWFSHIGWIFRKPFYPLLPLIDISDLKSDPIVRMQHQYYIPLAIFLGFVLPAGLATLWGDFWGGLLYCGHVGKIFAWHSTFCINSLAHWVGSQDYSENHTARGNLLLAILTNGEGTPSAAHIFEIIQLGHHNFHHEFPKDYRNGVAWYDYDPTKWLIWLTAKLGLASGLWITPKKDIEKARLVTMEQKVVNSKGKYYWGPEAASLPRLQRFEVDKMIEAGRAIVIIEGLVYDVTEYLDEHPGGSKLLKSYFGRDATKAFNGGLNNHSQAARTRSKEFLLAILEN